MVQATTPTFVLTLPSTIDLSEAEHILFSIEQNFVTINKDEEDIDVASNVATIRLDQEDTVALSKGNAKIQLNWTYSDGSRACTEVKNIVVGENLHKAVIE